MNTQLTPPPNHDLRPATRNRQRDELIAIVDHESAQQAPRRRLVPLAAAAAIVAVTAGLAIGVPALRGDKGKQPPVAGTSADAAAKPATAPLSAAEKTRYVKACNPTGTPALPASIVLDSFKWVNPPAGTHAAAWVVLKYKGKGHRVACGFDTLGKSVEMILATKDQILWGAVDKMAAGGGIYARSVARVTVAFGTEPAIEAVLRGGFFFAPLKYKDTLVRPEPDSAPTYTVRAYDASGKVVYASARTFREQQAQLDSCYTNPEGTKVVYSSTEKPTPPPSKCKRGVAWGW
ncbi:MAG: hypothetical protein QOH03_4341 [Kribbellaceae bacterium]|jgi:hypothetical protein|nr:hypothetical protein [Kribbellaceae bacterium]